jgi:hypothetical protein
MIDVAKLSLDVSKMTNLFVDGTIVTKMPIEN